MFTAPTLDSIEAQPPVCVQHPCPPSQLSLLGVVAERRPAGRRPWYGPLRGPVNSSPLPAARRRAGPGRPAAGTLLLEPESIKRTNYVHAPASPQRPDCARPRLPQARGCPPPCPEARRIRGRRGQLAAWGGGAGGGAALPACDLLASVLGTLLRTPPPIPAPWCHGRRRFLVLSHSNVSPGPPLGGWPQVRKGVWVRASGRLRASSRWWWGGWW